MSDELANLLAPCIDVIHFQLTPMSEKANKWASICPACKAGTLGVGRDRKTLVLQELDRCLLCGQQVRYLDIEDMRRRDWARPGQLNIRTEDEESP